MKLRLEQQMQNYIEIQKQNETEFKDEYEYVIGMLNQAMQIKEELQNKVIYLENEKIETCQNFAQEQGRRDMVDKGMKDDFEELNNKMSLQQEIMQQSSQ